MSNIFLRKRKNINNLSKYKIISINKKTIDSGYVRHFPPANLDWSNSIYGFNKNYVKLLPKFEEMVTNLIKSYFNLYHIKTKYKTRRIRRLRVMSKRLSTNRIFVSKAEIKHTNNKVIFTVYIYNAEKKYLLNKLKKTDPILRFSKIRLRKRIKLINKKALKVIKLTKKIFFKLKKTIKWGNKDYSVTQQYKNFLKKSLIKERYKFYYKKLFWINKSKFEKTLLNPFNKLLCSFFEKKIQFNIVNLKYLYLNSYILSQIIAIKIKNRKNRPLRVLKLFFKKVKLPFLSKFSERFTYVNKREKKFLPNKVERFSKIKNALKQSNNKKNFDLLNQTLQEIFIKKKPQKDNYIENTILNTIKHKTVIGVRIEASGRISKRLIASRSVFKLRYKGTLKNLNSSYRGLSTVMLRGYAKSNIQYTKISSKVRNGSFGLKGWVNCM